MTHPTLEILDSYDSSSFSDDQLAIWNTQKGIYLGFLHGERDKIDRHIDPDATIWDSVVETIARGLGDLNKIRATRPMGEAKPVVTRFELCEPIIDVSGDMAISRHVIRVEETSLNCTERGVMRFTAGWKRTAGGWVIIHSHEDQFSVEKLD